MLQEDESNITCKTMDYFKSLLKLKKQQAVLTKDMEIYFDKLKMPSKITQSVISTQNALSIDRRKLMTVLEKNMFCITEELQSVKETIANSDDIGKIDTENYKQRLNKLTLKIQDLKTSLPLKELSEQQAKLETELNAFVPRLKMYERSEKFSVNSPIQSLNKMNDKIKCSKREEFEDIHTLVAQSGHTDGWNDEDHQMFLKLRKKSKNIPALVVAMQTNCPYLSTEAIVNHEAWYKIYTNLREKQKNALILWRQQKQLEKEEKKKNDKGLNLKIDLSAKKNETNNSARDEFANSSDKTLAEKDKKKDLIRQWKLEKEHKRLADEIEMKNQLQSRLIEKQRKRDQKFKKIREALDDYKTKKLSKTTTRKDPERKHNFDSILVEKFRNRDEEYVKKRTSMVQRAKKLKQRRLPCNKRKEISRNYTTLYDVTEVWKMKCENPLNKTKQNTSNLFIKDVPKLSASRWRNQESQELKDYFQRS